MKSNFHISLPCSDIDATRSFYIDDLGAIEGRSAGNWIDIDLFGHQMTFTKGKKFSFVYPHYNFQGHILPSFHFGVILQEQDWTKLYHALKEKQVECADEGTFLLSQSGEHKSFFIKDPDDYSIEFKCFKDSKEIFSS
jgi:extradiol dioxygenase family protein